MNRTIVIAIDDNYVDAAITMLNSLLKYSKGRQTNLFILNNGLEAFSKWVLKSLYKSHYKIHFIQVANTNFEKFHLSNHVTLATYYRLIIPDLLPKDITRIVYLDCDLLITGDVDYLFNVELNGKELSAAPNSLSNPEHFESLTNSGNHIYFNAGVLILNLDKMRMNNSSHKLMEIAKEYGTNLRFWDQDVLNIYYLSNFNVLSKSYNYMPIYFDKQTSASIKDISILHFAGAAKPWTKYCNHPLNYLWAQNNPTSITYRFFRVRKVLERKWKSILSRL